MNVFSFLIMQYNRIDDDCFGSSFTFNAAYTVKYVLKIINHILFDLIFREFRLDRAKYVSNFRFLLAVLVTGNLIFLQLTRLNNLYVLK